MKWLKSCYIPALVVATFLPSCQLAYKPTEHILYPKEAINPNKNAFYQDRREDYPLTVMHIKNDEIPLKSKTVLFTKNQKVVNSRHSLDVKLADTDTKYLKIQANAKGEYDTNYTLIGGNVKLTHPNAFGDLSLFIDYSMRESNHSNAELARTKIKLEQRIDNGFSFYLQADQSDNGQNDNLIYSGNIGYKSTF